MQQLANSLAETQHAIHRLDQEAKTMIATLGILSSAASKAREEMNQLIDIMCERQLLIERFNNGENANE